MEPETEVECNLVIGELAQKTKATRAGCRVALQNTGWDLAEAERFLAEREWARRLATSDNRDGDPPPTPACPND